MTHIETAGFSVEPKPHPLVTLPFFADGSSLTEFLDNRELEQHQWNAKRQAEQGNAGTALERLEKIYPDHLISSGEIVARMIARQKSRVALLVDYFGRRPILDIFNCGTHSDNRSYQVRTEAHGEWIGIDAQAHTYQSAGPVDPNGNATPAEVAMTKQIAQLRHQPNRGALYLGPIETRAGWQELTKTVGQDIDPGNLDGVANDPEAGGRIAITSEGMILYAEQILGCAIEQLNPAEICIVGQGSVGTGILQILAKRGITPGIVLASKEDVQNAAKILEGKPIRVLFGAARGNGIIKAGFLTPPNPDRFNLPGMTLAVDAGNAPHPETGVPGGNIDPATLPGSHVFATPFMNGVGPVTAGILCERLVDKVEHEVGLWRVRWAKLTTAIGSLAAKCKIAARPGHPLPAPALSPALESKASTLQKA